ncbi:hypothetical protein ONS95_003435 [Cadophora gregata]|uniref:uncharacterized protein n=1 Tax=Cadophora gregata TaxID=51156 RepID=UPI0026DD49FC|nr:uncharacterized protein ONS95_003435 [Cadophora gregata]KAK0108642.1 hypothetical protein ONS95_003435 [Cadophora gregata]KAK0108767.1 hypothetical protein ONS96_002612 [Cadophora gregata f. sp. sojae]
MEAITTSNIRPASANAVVNLGDQPALQPISSVLSSNTLPGVASHDISHDRTVAADRPYPSVTTVRRLAEKHPSAKDDLIELADALKNLENSHQILLHSRLNIIAEKDRLLEEKEKIIQDFNRRLKKREIIKQNIINQVKAEAARKTEEEVQARIYVVNENCNTLHLENAMLLASVDDLKERLRLTVAGLKRSYGEVLKEDSKMDTFPTDKEPRTPGESDTILVMKDVADTPLLEFASNGVVEALLQGYEKSVPAHKKTYRSPYASNTTAKRSLLSPATEQEKISCAEGVSFDQSYGPSTTPTPKYSSPYGNKVNSIQDSFLTTGHVENHSPYNEKSLTGEKTSQISSAEDQEKSDDTHPEVDVGMRQAILPSDQNQTSYPNIREVMEDID